MASFRDQYEFRLEHHLYDNLFFGRNYYFPVSNATVAELVDNFVCFFPIYDSYIQMAKGLPHRLNALTEKLSIWLQRDTGTLGVEAGESASDKVIAHAAKAAEMKVRVMPALRWQVFQRDHWKCVACGRSSHDGAILHVDHILPRSRGGLDVLSNLQTLCDICNIGKSNRDTTDLRAHQSQ
jgi:5-methylcytosine-specific restriction endonuclease McrA